MWKRMLRWWLIVMVMVMIHIVEGITLPGSGGSNVVPSIQATPRVNFSLFKPGSLEEGMAKIHDRFGSYLIDKANEIGCSFTALGAILKAESSGTGFDSKGRMIIRFENHVFKARYAKSDFSNFFQFDPETPFLGHKWRPNVNQSFQDVHINQDQEWRVLQFAQDMDDINALKSASYGVAQIMGFNHQVIGYSNVQAMFVEFSKSIVAQLDGMFDFVLFNSQCRNGLISQDFVAFASCYNGKGKADVYGKIISDANRAYTNVISAIENQADNTTQSPTSSETTTPSPAIECTTNGVLGTCISTSSCSAIGKSYPGLCPGPNSIQCCVPDVVCVPENINTSGICMRESLCNSNTSILISGLCPGDAQWKCCAPKPAPTPRPTTQSPTYPPVSFPGSKSCSYNGLAGNCVEKSTCTQNNGLAFEGICRNRDKSIQCCVVNTQCYVPDLSSSSLLNVSETGTCLRSDYCSRANFSSVPGHCLGNSNIHCCLGVQNIYKAQAIIDAEEDAFFSNGTDTSVDDFDEASNRKAFATVIGIGTLCTILVGAAAVATTFGKRYYKEWRRKRGLPTTSQMSSIRETDVHTFIGDRDMRYNRYQPQIDRVVGIANKLKKNISRNSKAPQFVKPPKRPLSAYETSMSDLMQPKLSTLSADDSRILSTKLPAKLSTLSI